MFFSFCLPQCADILFRACIYRIPWIMGRIEIIEVVVVHRLTHKIPGAGFHIQIHQPRRVEVFCFPELDDIFIAKFGRMTVFPPVIIVLRVAFGVHMPRIPVAVHRHGLRSPVTPDAEFSVPEPIRANIILQTVHSSTERAFFNFKSCVHRFTSCQSFAVILSKKTFR